MKAVRYVSTVGALHPGRTERAATVVLLAKLATELQCDTSLHSDHTFPYCLAPCNNNRVTAAPGAVAGCWGLKNTLLGSTSHCYGPVTLQGAATVLRGGQ